MFGHYAIKQAAVTRQGLLIKSFPRLPKHDTQQLLYITGP